jgi:hypothetical protein
MSNGRLQVIIGGVQKGGTTSLFGYFCEHPQLLAPIKGKELHFFDEETIDWRNPNYQILHDRFKFESIGKKAFEATPIYIFWPPALERIRQYNPKMKLIFLFRDPIERAWSNWKMEVIRGREILPFHLAIRDGRNRLRGPNHLNLPWRLFSYVERGFFLDQARKALALFPREQLLFLRSNDLKRDRRGTLDKIADFLDIDPFFEGPERRDHQTERVNYLLQAADVQFLRETYRDDVVEFAKLTCLDVSDWPTINPDVVIPG